jgi:non-ribosomal peptide synthetase component F/acyl carrier protein
LTEKERALFTSSAAFDLGYTVLYTSLLNGGELFLLPKELYLSGEVLLNYTRENEITYLKVTPSLLTVFVNHPAFSSRMCPGLRLVAVGGEAINVKDIKKLHDTCPDIEVMNHYGPTEATIGCVARLVDFRRFNEYEAQPTIGTPIDNTKAYILDKYFNLLPVGVPGELFISGKGVARGYLNRPELTAEKFEQDFQDYQDEKEKDYHHSSFIEPTHHSALYRTGDLARWLPDGNIEFLGRIDYQVKIRGYRIELGEIENRLLKHPAVEEAVVMAREDDTGDNYLCVYIIARSMEHRTWDESAADVKKYLAQFLPDYMIPSFVVPLQELPLTPARKVDRNALPAPEMGSSGREFTPPRNQREETLARIWARVLGIETEKISIDDSFFDLGGQSLKAVLLLSNIHETFNVRISMPDLFKKPFIRSLAEYIADAEEETYVPIEPAEKKEYYELSFHQKRLWIIQQLEEKNVSYNMPVRIELNHALDEKTIRKSLSRIIERHESLRTGFKTIDGVAFQLIEPSVALPLKIIDISSMGPREKEHKREQIFREIAGTSFDLSQAPLLRAMVIKSGETQHDLVFILHHIISDGWSMGILEREFTQLYNEYRAGRETTLNPPSPLQLRYKDFSEWHNRQLNNPQLKEASHRFWLEKLECGFPRLQLPVDFNADRRDSIGAAYRCRVGKEVKERLNRLARANTTTFTMVMFSIYNILLAHISAQEDIVCSLIGAGRDHRSLRHIVGYFTNSIMVKTRVDPEEAFDNLLRQVHDNVMEILQHQSYPLETVLDELKMSFPDIAASFNMLNMPGTSAAADIDTFEPHHIQKRQGVKFDLALFVTEHPNTIELLWNYRKSLFKPGTIESIAHIYLDLLDELSENEE